MIEGQVYHVSKKEVTIKLIILGDFTLARLGKSE